MSGDLPIFLLSHPHPVALSPQAHPILYVRWLLRLKHHILKVQFEVIKLVGQNGCGMGSGNSMSSGLLFSRALGLLSISRVIIG